MTGFEPRIFGIGSDRSANLGTTTAPVLFATAFGLNVFCVIVMAASFLSKISFLKDTFITF